MFEFAGVAPASYMVRLDSQDLYARMPVVIADRDIQVTLEISHGPSIQGTIKMDGGASFRGEGEQFSVLSNSARLPPSGSGLSAWYDIQDR